MIKDSGNRTEFETGAVRDVQAGKGRCDLLPLDVVSLYLGSEFTEDDPDDATVRKDVLYYVGTFQDTGDPAWLMYAVYCFVHAEFNFDGCDETAMLEYSIHLEEGCMKYGDRNWQKGIPLKNYVNSAVRHYLKHRRGDTDERHDRAFVWNCLCGVWTAMHYPDLNDYPISNS